MGKFKDSNDKREKLMSIDRDMSSIGNSLGGIADVMGIGRERIPSPDMAVDDGDEGGGIPGIVVQLPDWSNTDSIGTACCCGSGTGSLIDEDEIIL